MCGLVGVAGDIFTNEKKAFRTLLELDVLRGRHSTGVAIINRDDKLTLCKEVGVPEYLYNEYPKEFYDDGTVQQMNLRLLMGHNRWATTGKKTAENAHPFHHGNIVGAHNGTLTPNYLHHLEDGNKFDVDSEAIFYNINKNGVDATLSKLHGAWALTWYDFETHELNINRNKERSLFYSWSGDGKTVFWASEGWMLTVALNRSGIAHSEPEAFKENAHYTLELEGNSLKDTTFLFDEKDIYRGFQPPVVRYSSNYNNPFTGSTGSSYHAASAKNNNVSNNASVITKDDIEARSLHQKIITFEIVGERLGRNNDPYLMCVSNDVPFSYEVRLYGKNHTRWAEWISSRGFYTGVIRNINTQFNAVKNTIERYMLLDLRTISETATDIVNDSVFERSRVYTLYGGELGGLSLFLDRTKNGCAECGVDIQPHEVDDITWVGVRQFVCPVCNKRHNIGL